MTKHFVQCLVILSSILPVLAVSSCSNSSGGGTSTGSIEGSIVMPDGAVAVLADGIPAANLSLSYGANEEKTLSTDESCGSYGWIVDGQRKAETPAFVLRARDYGLKTHSLTLEIQKDGIWYSSSPIAFSVVE